MAAIVAMKHRHPSFGPKTIRDRLRAVASEEAWPSSRASPRRPAPIALVLVAMLTFGASPASALTPVCSNAPGTGERIECTEDATSTSDIDIDAVDVDIDTSVDNEPGVHAKHEGAGKIDVEVGSDTAGTIDTAGLNAHGIHGEHTGTGDITIHVQKTEITTTDSNTYVIDTDITLSGDAGTAVYGDISDKSTEGDVLVDVDGAKIVTTGVSAFGIRGSNRADVGDVRINVRNSTVDSVLAGIFAERAAGGRGAINLDVRDTEVTTTGFGGFGIQIGNGSENPTADDVQKIFVENATITTKGREGFGIVSTRQCVGDIVIETRNVDIVTESTELSSFGDTLTHGIYARHTDPSLASNPVEEGGDIDINVQGGSIETKGAYSYGIRGNIEAGNGGGIYITTSGGNTITTMGEGGHGIVGDLYGMLANES